MADIQPSGGGHARGAVIIGTAGHLVAVDTAITSGPAAFSIAGLPADQIRETRDQIRARRGRSTPWRDPGQLVTVEAGEGRLRLSANIAVRSAPALDEASSRAPPGAAPSSLASRLDCQRASGPASPSSSLTETVPAERPATTGGMAGGGP